MALQMSKTMVEGVLDVSQTRVGLGRPCPYLEAAEGDSHDTAEVGTDIQIDGSGNSR